ncbi:hypothetical protein ACGFNU_06660 [Spirillospora sp. NPDC048911]|uniref:hypothetical protein n=1 Tax=Spirillospora sp. NPDC048911 TaxID=3364527 RepID=UPI00371FA629
MKRFAVVLCAAVAASVLSPIANAATDGSADLGVTVEAPDSVMPGKRYAFYAKVWNSGPDAAEEVKATFDWPAELHVDQNLVAGLTDCVWGARTATCDVKGGSLAAGEERRIGLVGTVDLQADDRFDFRAGVRAKTTEPNPDWNRNDHSGMSLVYPSTDLAVTMSGPATAKPGDLITYEAKVTNNGPRFLWSANVDFNLSNGVVFQSSSPECNGKSRCRLENFDKNETRTLRVTVKVHEAVPVGSRMYSAVEAYWSLNDPVRENDSAAVETLVVAPPKPPRPVVADVGISGKVGALRKGRTGTYTLTVANRGPAAAKNVVVSGALPKGLRFKSVRGCKKAGNGIKCTIANLKAGGKVTIVLNVAVAKSASGSRLFVAGVKSATKDPVSGNDRVRITRKITK